MIFNSIYNYAMSSYPKSIVFDLDGTLIDSAPAIVETLNRVFIPKGVDPISQKEGQKLIGFGAKWMIGQVLKRGQISTSASEFEGLMSQFYEEYKRISSQFTLVYEGVIDTLYKLQSQKVKMAICTNKPGSTTNAVLQELGLLKFFDAVVTEDDVEYRKPDPRHLYKTLEKIGSNTKETIFVGDSETDMQTAGRAGVRFIFVTYGYCHISHSDISALKFIDNFSDLPNFLMECKKTV